MAADAGALMRKMIGAFATGDLSEIDTLVSPDYVDHEGIGGVEVHGPAGFRQVVSAARGSFSNLEVTVEDLITDGDRAAARVFWRGVLPGDSRIERETIDIVRFANGQAVEHWGAEAMVRTG
jgi:predicted ester cyclase